MRATHKTHKPIKFFDNFFPHDLVELLVKQTNIYAAQRQALHWSPTFVAEMRAYLGIFIMMGLHIFHDVNLYWSTDTFYRNHDISQTFTQKRFKKLTENIHLNDNTKEPAKDTPGHDKLYKIRTMITKLNEVFHTQCSQSSTQSKKKRGYRGPVQCKNLFLMTLNNKFSVIKKIVQFRFVA